jgi:hypothetical protein
VILGMRLGSLGRVIIGILLMALRYLRVMGGLLVVAGFVMLRGFPMMASCIVVAVGSLIVVLCSFFGHDISFFGSN